MPDLALHRTSFADYLRADAVAQLDQGTELRVAEIYADTEVAADAPLPLRVGEPPQTWPGRV